MKFYFPIHLDGDNRGCEGIAKGTAQLLDLPKEQLIGLCRDIHLDKRLGIDRFVTLRAKRDMSFIQRVIRKLISFTSSDKAVDYAYNAAYGAFLNEMQQDDIMLSTGGDMMCYNDNEVIYTNNFVHQKEQKSILWGCSIGKNNLTPAKTDTLSKFTYIYARESLTYDLLKSMNLNNVILYPDPAFILSPEKCSLPEIFKRGRVVGINLSNYVVGSDNLDTPFGAEVCRLIDYIINETDLNILLIPHVLWKGQDDRIISQEVIKRYKSNRLEVLNSELLNYEQIRYVISQCHLFIGARTHAVISAYATCTPAIAIGYSVKSRGIAKDLGLDETLIVDSKVFSKNQLLDSFCNALEHESETRTHLETVIPNYVRKLYTLKECIADSICHLDR